MILDFDDFDVRDRFYLIEEKAEQLRIELDRISPEKQHTFNEICMQAYIFHDSALDGIVVTGDEIAAVFSFDADTSYIRSRTLQEIRNQRKALYDIINNANKLRLSNTIYSSAEINIELILATHEELFYNTPRKDAGKLRTQVPLHIAYFHNMAEPKAVKEKLLRLCEETKDYEFRTQHPINQATIFHHQFMQIFPFMEGAGKVGRLFMNSFLLQGGYDLAIIHQSERQRYYETLRSNPSELRLLLLDSIESSIDSRINLIINYNLSLLGNKSIIRKNKTGVFINP